MFLEVDNHSVVIFDLDDTLYQELDFLISGYKSIIDKYFKDKTEEIFDQMMLWYSSNANVFSNLLSFYKAEKNQEEYSTAGLLSTYRNHFPQISLNPGANKLLEQLELLGCKQGLITDGRSITQRNKIKALGIEQKFDLVVISEEFGSEKPDPNNFQVFLQTFPKANKHVYIADNPKKDFVIPNTFGWVTICLLDRGRNIHKQNFNLENQFLPQIKVNSLLDIHL